MVCIVRPRRGYLLIILGLESDIITQVKRIGNSTKPASKKVVKLDTDFVKKLKQNQESSYTKSSIKVSYSLTHDFIQTQKSPKISFEKKNNDSAKKMQIPKVSNTQEKPGKSSSNEKGINPER